MNHQEYLTMSLMNELGYVEAHLIKDFDENQKLFFISEYKRQKKNTTAALLLGIFIGEFGAHHFYLGDKGKGAAYLVISLVSCVLTLAVIGIIGLVTMKIIALVEMIDIGNKVEQSNRQAAYELANKIKNGFGFTFPFTVASPEPPSPNSASEILKDETPLGKSIYTR
jgi:TM2 domain-containing membrane protein YozV